MDKKKTQILKAAVRLVSQKGYKETTMRDIAKKIGVTAPALYNFIGKKEEILVWLAEGLYEKFKENYETSRNSSLNPLEKFNEFLSLHLASIYDNFDYFQTALRYWKIADEQANGKYSQFMDEYIRYFDELALVLIPKEVQENSFNPRFFPTVLMLIANELPNWIDSEYKPFDFDQIARGLSDRLLNGYAEKAP